MAPKLKPRKGPPTGGAPNAQAGIGFLPPGARPAGSPLPPYGDGNHNHGNAGGGHAAKGKGKGKGKGKTASRDQDDGSSSDFAQYHGDDAFMYRFDEDFFVPPRLAPVPRSLVEAVNDFHYAMMNDTPRNQFYYDLLKSYVTPETGVLEIGAGSGLLSMMAAKLGAKWVVAVEGSPEMSQLARHNIKANHFQDKIKVLNMLSTELTLKDLPERPHVLVSEIFGTMLLGESALDYIADVRQRLLRPDTKIIPQLGVQYAVPIECPVMDQVCSVGSWNGLDLSHVMAIKDTTSIVFTKQYGFRLSSVPYTFLAEPLKILDIDFAKTSRKDLRRSFDFTVDATTSGTAHAWLFFFAAMDFVKPAEGEAAEMLVMSTNPRDTVDNFPRDMQWGQALQLIDTDRDPAMPCALQMEQGRRYKFCCRFSEDRVITQMRFLGIEGEQEGQPEAAAAVNEAAKAEEVE